VPSTKKPAVVAFPDDLTVMQIDCGTFHTAVLLHSGEVYTFGNGNHGQLGQGNNKVW
jgi:RCC1 and BTB domain-containing protein